MQMGYLRRERISETRVDLQFTDHDTTHFWGGGGVAYLARCQGVLLSVTGTTGLLLVDCVRNVMAHAQKPDFVFRRNGRVHLNRRGRHFSRLLAAEMCASAVVMRDTLYSEVVWRILATHSIRQFSLHFPSCASPCAITFQLDSTNKRRLHSYTRDWKREAFRVACVEQVHCASAARMSSKQLVSPEEISRMPICRLPSRNHLLVCGQYTFPLLTLPLAYFLKKVRLYTVKGNQWLI